MRFLNYDQEDIVAEFENCKSITPELLKKAYDVGMIPKSSYIIGQYYFGSCRNASVAKWDGKEFKYVRTKWGNSYIDELNCPEDDDGYDVFKPFYEIEPTEEEKI